MKKSLKSLLMCLVLIGCKPYEQSVKYKKQMEEAYVFTFKITYFRQLLTEAFGNSDAIREALATDHSGFGEPILSIQDLALIDSFSKVDNQVIVLDSVDRVGRVGEGAQGKQILSFALFRYQSKWLDSLAKVRYKRYWRSQNLYDIE
ncbi:MAG: hypothetical protein ACK5PO_02080 [Bacteroidota bacterium]|jgi:hypothetical protein